MTDKVCPYCNRPLMKIDQYGEVLIGCIDCRGLRLRYVTFTSHSGGTMG